MSYKIIVDSCCDLTPAQFLQGPFIRVPLTISLAGEEIIDDDTFDQNHLLLLMRENAEPPQTACPSPAQFLDAFEQAEADDLYVVTMSALVSGSHNSAAQAQAIWMEDHPEAHLHIFNSCSAVAGEVQVALKLQELAESGLPFADVVKAGSKYITELTTYFVLEDLDHLRKNGRLTGALALVTEALRIKLLMRVTPEGEIKKVGQALSIRQALTRMVSLIANDPNHVGKTLALVHCNDFDRAVFVRGLIQKSCQFSDIRISDTRGISTAYANNGGIVVAY